MLIKKISTLNFVKKIFLLIIFTRLLFTASDIACRSHLRKSHEKKPKIEVSRVAGPKIRKVIHKHHPEKNGLTKPRVYFLASNKLEKNPIFKTFDKEHFYSHMLPEKITYRYDQTKFVTKEELSAKLEKLVRELKKKKRKYKDFKILKQTDFNRRHKSGLLILKFKDYPFVAKVFIENPKFFVKPYSKGLCPTCFFTMSGGICRHLLGFTRIKNLEKIQNKISQDPKWSKKVIFPRKWYWLPKDPKNMKIVGKNFDKNNAIIETIIPGTYFLIADEIMLQDKKNTVYDKKTKSKCLKLCNFVNVRLDPNPSNFLFEKDTNKIAVIDTENFLKMVGLKGEVKFDNYLAWYFKMASKYIDDMFFKPKRCC